jgi:hypothetical protein
MADVPTTTTTSSLPVAEDYTQLDDKDGVMSAQPTISPASPTPVSTKPSSSRRSLRKSFSQSNRNKKLIIFASASKYQWLIAFLVVSPLIAILMSIILFDVQSQEEYKNSSTIWILGWCFIFIMVTYMAVLPRQVDVRSNGKVAIKTCLLTFFIDDIARAYRGGNMDSGFDVLLRPRVMLATSLDRDGAVVIRRHHGKWDVVVTPEDPEGFVHAVEQIVRQTEDQSDDNFVAVGHNYKRKPNLASSAQPV